MQDGIEVKQERPKSLEKMERVEGIEPSTKAWEAFVLPLNYTRFGAADFVPEWHADLKR